MGMQLITSGPTSHWGNIAMVFLKAISNAKKYVYLQTPYFLPTESLLKALQCVALAGVDVRVMIPLRSDSLMLKYASRSYIAECLRSGIKIYFYEPGMLHSKTLVIDDEMTSVGSTNFDFRSFEHNFEGNLNVYSPEFARRMKEIFLADTSSCRRVNATAWRHRPITHKAIESFMRLFSPIL
jgi:cardiolipin synthase